MTQTQKKGPLTFLTAGALLHPNVQTLKFNAINKQGFGKNLQSIIKHYRGQ